MRVFKQFKNSFKKIDADTREAFKSAIPASIDLTVNVRGDSYIATIKTIDHQPLPKDVLLVTEAESEEKLVDMVNDLIFTYKNIPEHYRPFYKQILKPTDMVSANHALTLVKAS